MGSLRRTRTGSSAVRFSEEKHRSYFQYERREMLSFLPDRYSRVLEIGCGEGNFGAMLAQAEEVWGIEPDDASAELARTRLHKVFSGTYDEVEKQLPDEYYDLVICNDVIEHMPDHDRFLTSIRTKMVPGGSIVASVPNVRYIRNLVGLFVRKDWKYERSGILDRTHLRFFTLKSLRRAFLEHQFEVIDLRGIAWGLSAFDRATFMMISVLSLTTLSDVRFGQIGIRARKPNVTA